MKMELKQELNGTMETLKIAMKTELKEELNDTIEAMKDPLKTELESIIEAMKSPLKSELKASFSQEIVSTSTSIVQRIIVPDLDQKLSTKVDKLKEEVKDDLKSVVEAMKAPLKAQLKTEFDQQIADRLEEYTPNLETIVTASSVIVRNILVPEMEQKVSINVNEIRSIVKSELKSELDQDFSSGMTNLSQQIDTKINEEQDELTQHITTQITETQEKIIFAVVRKSTVERGQPITFDTVIANIGGSIDATSGTFTSQRTGLYFFTFYAVSKSSGSRTHIVVSKNNDQIFRIEDTSTSSDQSNIASSWMLQLDQDDTINLKLTSENGLHGCSEEDWIHFTGQFLNAN